MKWFYISLIVLASLLVGGFIVYQWFIPAPEVIIQHETIIQDHIIVKEVCKEDAKQDDKVDSKITNLDNKNYNKEKVIQKQKEWLERKELPTMSSNSYTNEPTNCAKLHNRSLC